jgi:4-amino-4-deoxy-L-arabinose transferase-like glycosyltransferase
MRERIAGWIDLTRDPSNERRALFGILALAAVMRLALAPLVTALLGYLPDVLRYRAAAADLLTNHMIVDHRVMPGYPLLILLSGGGGFGQLLADTALAVASVWCIARLTRILTGDAMAGLCAALIWAVYPFSVFYAVVGLSETLFVALVLLGFLAYQTQRFALGSLLMVLGILTRPELMILAPILILAFSLVVHRQTITRALKHLVVFAVLFLALMSPWWWHNYAKYGQFVPLNLGGGMVLYAGNNPNNTDGGGVDVKIDVPGYFDTKDPVARDRMLRQAAFRFIAEHPKRFVELAGLKFLRLWLPWPHAAEYSNAPLAIVTTASYLPLLLLALGGLAVDWRRYGRNLVPIVLYVGYMTAIHMVTIGSVRYRFPMVPFLAILAGAPAAWLLQWLFGPRKVSSVAATES